MSFNAVIFDLDGTLLDTLDGIAYSLNKTLETRGLKPRTLNEIKAATGNGARYLIKASLPKNTPDALIDSILQEYRSALAFNSLPKTKPYKGIPELLQTLNSNNILCAVLSNKPDEAVKELCAHFFPNLLKTAIGESPGAPKKPDAAAVELVLAQIGAIKDTTLITGDSEVDIAAAKNSGLTSVGVTWGFRERGVLIGENADYIIDAPAELLGIVL